MRVRKPHEGARHGGETIPESVLTANTLWKFVTESPTMEQTMPKFPTMGNIVTESPWRKVPRRRQPCRTATRGRTPCRKDHSRETWLGSAWKVVTVMTDETFLESDRLKKIDPESPTREHAMAERPFPKVSRL